MAADSPGFFAPVHTGVRLLDWADAAPLVSPLRLAVFVHEQGVPESEEWDEWDVLSRHAVLTGQTGQVLATGRVWRDAYAPSQANIGRLAVQRNARQQGLGRCVLHALMQQAQAWGCRTVCLHAQTSAQGFYEAEGFVPVGPVYDEVGIAHITMGRELPPAI